MGKWDGKGAKVDVFFLFFFGKKGAGKNDTKNGKNLNCSYLLFSLYFHLPLLTNDDLWSLEPELRF